MRLTLTSWTVPNPHPGSQATAPSTHGSGSARLPRVEVFTAPGWFLLLAVVALAFRVALFLQYLKSPFLNGLILDADLYWLKAEKIAHGAWLPDGVSSQSPLYPYLLGVMRYLFPSSTPAWVAIIQLVLNWVTCLLFLPLVRRWADERVALAAASLALFFSPAVFLATKVLNITVGLFFMQLGFLAFSAGLCGRRWLRLVAGALWGIGALATPTILPAPILFLLSLLVWRPSRRRLARPRDIVAVFLGLFLAIAPVTLSNYQQDGSLVLISSNYGLVFYEGNNPKADGTFSDVNGISSDLEYRESDAIRLAHRETGKMLNAGEVARHYLGKGFRFIRKEPWRYLLLLGKKSVFLLGDKYFGSEYHLAEERRDFLGLLWLFPVGGLAILMLAAFSVAGRGGGSAAVPLLLRFALSQMPVCLLFYVNDRYVLPFQFFAIPVAALGLAPLRGPFKELVKSLEAVFVIALFAVLSYQIAGGKNVWTNYRRNLAGIYGDRGETAKAVEVSRRVLEQFPGNPNFMTDLAARYHLNKDDAAAIALLNDSLSVDPTNAGTRLVLAWVYYESKQLPQAVAQLEEALKYSPGEARLRFKLSDVFLALGQLDKAEEQLRQIVGMDPGDYVARYQLSGILRSRYGNRASRDELLTVVAMKPTLGEAWVELARDEYATGEFQAAALAVKKALSLNYPVDKNLVEAVKRAVNGNPKP